MTIVQLSTAHAFDLLLRQSPQGDGRWEDIDVRLGADAGGEADWLIVFDHPARDLTTSLPRERRIVFLPEPASIKHYDPQFIAQFGVAFTASPLPDFDGIAIHTQPLTPWFYGAGIGASAQTTARKSYTELAAGPIAGEGAGGRGEEGARALLSAVCSTKTLNRNQVRRLRFLRRVKATLGARLDIYGRGFQEIADKAEGLDGYRYHLVLENNLDPHCWTEKLADPLLAGVYPIFAGGPDLEAYFDPLGFTAIDITRPDSALAGIVRVLAEDPVSRPEVRGAMRENRRRLMEEHQFFPVLAAELSRLGPAPATRLEAPVPVRPPVKPPLHRLTRAFRPLRILADKAHVALVERG
ncbi:hypothetical protein [Stappia sp. MMSF_3263]|uniref:hypothetical protein n=1 Tax=Stappia sp. MMSF_3263 TaxID=3046693 RepID=UPI00273DA416|nr:hypothetical protein [Stappia sp. MMSF_3263]